MSMGKKTKGVGTASIVNNWRTVAIAGIAMKRQLQRDKVPLQPLHTIDVCSTGIGLRSKSRVSPERDSRRGRIAAVSKACIRFHGDRYTLLMCVVPATTVNRNKTRASPCGDSCGETRSRRNRYTLLMCVVPAVGVRHYRVHRPSATAAVEG